MYTKAMLSPDDDDDDDDDADDDDDTRSAADDRHSCDDVRTGVVGRNSVKQQSVDGVDNRCDDEQVVRERVAALRERRRGERVERQPLVAR